jgi:NADH-quinone oxidoreductase subunit G
MVSVPWDVALDRAASVIRGQGLRLAVGPQISNEAIWVLSKINRALDGDRLSGPSNPWAMRGRMEALLSCKLIVLVGLDAWHELPVLALWIRKAVDAGARLVVIGPENGLFRDTAHWARVPAGGEAEAIRQLIASPSRLQTESRVAGPSLSAALQGRPAAVIAGERVGQDSDALEAARALAERLEAGSGEVPLGIPSVGANARGLLDLAPEISPYASANSTLRFGDGLSGHRQLNGESIEAAYRSSAGGEGNTVVLLPLAHPYEQEGSFTNLDGRVQVLRAGAQIPGQALADWDVAARLAERLDVPVPRDLASIRAAMLADHPEYASALRSAELTRA